MNLFASNVTKSAMFAIVICGLLSILAWAMTEFLSLRALNFVRLTNGFWISCGLIFLIRFNIYIQRDHVERLTIHRAEVKQLVADTLKRGDEDRKEHMQSILTGLKLLSDKQTAETRQHNELVATSLEHITQQRQNENRVAIQTQTKELLDSIKEGTTASKEAQREANHAALKLDSVNQKIANLDQRILDAIPPKQQIDEIQTTGNESRDILGVLSDEKKDEQP